MLSGVELAKCFEVDSGHGSEIFGGLVGDGDRIVGFLVGDGDRIDGSLVGAVIGRIVGGV